MERDRHLLHLLAEEDVPIVGGPRLVRRIRELIDPASGATIHRLRESLVGDEDLTLALLRESDLGGSDWANRRLPTFDDWQRRRAEAEDTDEAGEDDVEARREFEDVIGAAHLALDALLQSLRQRRATNTSLGLDG